MSRETPRSTIEPAKAEPAARKRRPWWRFNVWTVVAPLFLTMWLQYLLKWSPPASALVAVGIVALWVLLAWSGLLLRWTLRQRRRYQLLVLAVLLSPLLALSILSAFLWRAHQRYLAIDRLQKAGYSLDTNERVRTHAGYRFYFGEVTSLQGDGNTPAPVLENLRYLSGLEEVALYNLDGEWWLKFLSEQNELTHLELSDARSVGENLHYLWSLPQLEVLELSDCGLTDAALKQLTPLQNLTKLDLSGNPITDAGLVHLRHLKNLTHLFLFDNPPITNAGLVHLRRLKNLQFVALYETQITNAGLQKFRQALPPGVVVSPEGILDSPEEAAVLEQLRGRDLALWILHVGRGGHVTSLGVGGVGNDATDRDLEAIGKLRHLTDLRLTGTFTDEGTAHLRPLRQLEEVKLESPNMTGKTLAVFGQHPRLVTLVLREARIGDDDLARLANIPTLKMLVIKNSPITDDGLVHLANLPRLVGLCLNDAAITGSGFKYLNRLPTLKCLWLTNCLLLEARHFAHLRGSALERFALTGAPLDDSVVPHLLRLPKLRMLDISNTDLSSAAIQKLRVNIPEVRSRGLFIYP